MKKYASTTELANVYPAWTKVRADDQSVGQQILNSVAGPIDKMDKTIFTMGKNNHLMIANLDEIDLVYKLQLPTTFTFEQNTDDPLKSVSLSPTVTGHIDSDQYILEAVDNNTLQDFWYNASPSRFTIDDTITNNHHLITFLASAAPLTVDLEHHLGGGKLWIETSGGTQYLTVEDGILSRARIIIRGVTRKGTEESETIIFPWDMKQATLKEWKSIEKIEVFDMEDEVEISIRSGDFDNSPYIDAYNLSYSNTRRKVDVFWDIGSVVERPTLDMVSYVSDEWENLAIGFTDMQVVQSWELLDEDYNTVSGIDIAIQPFSKYAWVVTASGMIYKYDLFEETISGVELLKGRTMGPHVQFEYDTRYLIRDEDFKFIPWHTRPIKEIESYRVWYRTPSGTKYGLLNGTPVSFTSDFTIKGIQLQRSIENQISITLDELGEYLFVVEASFVDKTQHIEKIIAKTMFKLPLCSLDLSSELSYTVSGIDYDADQVLWAKDMNGSYHKIGMHYDSMLIDYDKKVIYFREKYDTVDVGTP